ncbi:MAG: hypothetical protein K2Q10_12900, partial [Rhodospirillales bacterium]|nr:hypothetical protein [Rhodospirillales bacterium]
NTGLKRLLFPFTFTFNSRAAGEVDMFDARVLAAFLLVLVAVPAFLLRRRVGPRLSMHGSTGYVLGAATLSYAVWLGLFGIYRYLIPLEMLAPLLVVLAAGLLPLNLRVRAGLAAAIVAMLVLTAYPGNWLRVDWERKAVTAAVPTIGQADRTMVLMAGHEPLSFLIPAFPPAMRFVRIDSTFTNPEESGVRFNELMRRMVGEHQGPLAALYIPTEEHDVVKRLADHGLMLDKDSCQPVTSPIGAAPYAYCRVVRNRS